MNDIILVMSSYIAIIGLSIGILAWLQAGFFGAFFKVKTSRGKKILVKLMKPTGADFIAADIVEGSLYFKYKKEKKLISKFEEGIYRAYNINCVDMDSKTWGIIIKDFSAVSTNDPTKTDFLVERALMRPDKKLTKENIMIFMLIIIILICLFIAYKLNFLAGGGAVAGVITGGNL